MSLWIHEPEHFSAAVTNAEEPSLQGSRKLALSMLINAVEDAKRRNGGAVRFLLDEDRCSLWLDLLDIDYDNFCFSLRRAGVV